MRFELLIALRHLASRKAHSGLISIITAISILGVIIGVMALVTVIAVIDGAQEDYLSRLIDEFAHIEIWPGYGNRLPAYQRIMEIAEQDPDVLAASPMLKHYALLKYDPSPESLEKARPAQIMGIDPEREAKVSRIGDPEKGKYIGKRIPGEGEAVLGQVLAHRMRLRVGDRVYAVTGQTANPANGMVARQYPLEVAGIFESGIFEIDDKVAYVDIPTSQDMNLMPVGTDQVDLVHLRLTDPYLAERVRARLDTTIRQEIGVPVVMRTWGELNPELFKALALEKLAMYVICLLVVAVAGLNVIGTLILVSMEKTREIGILRAMGVSQQSVSRIFLIEGALIGLAGTFLGICGGLVLCWFLKYHCPVDIPEAVYGLDGLPVVVKPMTVTIIAVSSMSICLIASVIPAVRAARLDIVEALRYE